MNCKYVLQTEDDFEEDLLDAAKGAKKYLRAKISMGRNNSEIVGFLQFFS